MGRFGNSKRTLPENEEKMESRAFSKNCAVYARQPRSYLNAYIRPRAQKRPEGIEASPAYPQAQNRRNGAIGDLKQPGTTKAAKTQTSWFLGSW